MKRRNVPLAWLGTALALSAALPAAVYADDDCTKIDPAEPAEIRPAPQGDTVAFVTGGVGAQEAEALRAVKPGYPLALTLAENRGGRHHFTARVHVDIRDASGARVLCADGAGPFLFAKLPAGDYRIVATSMEGVPLTREVSVVPNEQADVTLAWGP